MAPRPARSTNRSPEVRSSRRGSNRPLSEKALFWRRTVGSWRTPPDAWRWFRARGIEDFEVADAAWLRSAASDQRLRSDEQGAGSSLYKAIVSDERFRGDFSQFQVWMQPWRDFTVVVSSWQSPDDAIAWARAYELSARKLVDSCWLRKTPLVADRDGFKGLYTAILEDPRFARRFSKFSSWLKQGSGDSDVVASWRTREDALIWAAHQGLDIGSLSDETAFRSARRRMHRAILNDPRFGGSFKKFKAWLDLGTVRSPVVSSWRDKEDAQRWADLNGISVAELGSLDSLTDKGLSAIVAGVLSDPRFGGDFNSFRRWLRIDIDYVALVRGWKDKQDALDWATSTGVSWGFLDGLVIAPERHLEALRRAVLEDPRFEGDIARFRVWLGLEPDYHSLVRQWATSQDALAWAKSRGITAANLGRRSWLINTSAFPEDEGGIGECLEGLVKAISLDPRFGGDFSKFRRWLGVNNWKAVVQSWKTPRDAHMWAAGRGTSWQAVATSTDQSRNAQSDEELAGLVEAIVRDPRFAGGLPMFLSWLDGSGV
jgi:hypothetical protein